MVLSSFIVSNVRYDPSCTHILFTFAKDDIIRSVTSSLFRSRKWDLIDWLVILYTNETTCSGVLLSSDWLLSASECWKEYQRKRLMYHLASFGKGTEDKKFIHIENIVFYPGLLDIVMVKMKDFNETLVKQYVFPCILSEEGSHYAVENRVSGIIEIRIPSKSSKSTNVRYRGLPLRVVKDKDSTCSDVRTQMCAKVPSRKNLDIPKLVTRNAPFFVKVGKTRWSLAGLSVSANQDAVNFEPLSKAIRWIDGLMFE